MKITRRRILAIVLLLGLAFSGYVIPKFWRTAGRITAPGRYLITPEHRQYLENDHTHGVVIEEFSGVENQVVALIIRPDSQAGPSVLGKELRKAMTAPSAFGEEAGILFLLHGHGGRKENLLPVAERFCAAGFICILPDLPSHGYSPLDKGTFGANDFEKSFLGQLADEVQSHLKSDLPCSLWGASMGGCYAIHAVAHKPDRWRNLCIVSSFDDLTGFLTDSTVNRGKILAAPIRWILFPLIEARGEFKMSEVKPAEKAATITIPALVIHGEKDDLISLERGKSLHDSFAGPKELIVLPDGTHDNVLTPDVAVYARMAEWLLR